MTPRIAVILPAAGQSTRFGKDKLQERLGDRTVLSRSIEAFTKRNDVAQIIIATSKAAQSPGAPGPGGIDRRIKACAGGSNRAESVLNALRATDPTIEWIAVHDAARPLVSQQLIDRTLAAAIEHGAAVPAMPVHLTIKKARGPLPARVEQTIPRHELWSMQTPQIARRAALLEAFERCPIPLDQITDDMQLLELAGQEVWLIPGEEQNLKITTPVDLELARLLSP
ncbi:MAG TPA: 2-C-methyl-D-erythritol 4-phosphate cytidylyltransferase [Tepidisphaeraceae bacterium]|jgi:2-C-methyl-D-erythritol 4-phosphate cytidylyltransferase|nr:2-C-methyl-D-erythritol 4-phosphate cytidylyltransferase [Tepidisphaeraceae bacterium]